MPSEAYGAKMHAGNFGADAGLAASRAAWVDSMAPLGVRACDEIIESEGGQQQY
jgi:hypothetical protein